MSVFLAAEQRRRVHGLIERAQDTDHVGVREELAGVVADAERHDDVEVRQLAAAAMVFYDLLHSNDPDQVGADCEELLRTAEAVKSPSAHVMAMSLRAVHATTSQNKEALLADAGLASALAERENVEPYEKCFVWTTLSNVYISLNLWELADELNERAGEFAGACEEPEKQLAAVCSNRFLIRLAWAAALLEHGDRAEAMHHLRVAEQSASWFLTSDTSSPLLWLESARATNDLLTFFLHCTQPGTDFDADAELAVIAGRRDVLTGVMDAEVLPYINGFTALGLLHLGRIGDACALLLAPYPDSTTAPAQVFQHWIRARALAPAQPDEATVALQEYAALVCDLRWSARAEVLAAARARIDEARLVAEHALLSVEVMRDSLTGLHNRRSFDAWLSDRTGPDGSTALLLLDVDEFKHVNDTYGHGAGDEVLRRIAAAINEHVREGDVGIRIGGDEFAVVMNGSGRLAEKADAAAMHVVARSRATAIAAAVAGTDWAAVSPGLSVTVTVGVASGRAEEQHDGTAAGLYRSADEDLYVAKSVRAAALGRSSAETEPFPDFESAVHR